MRRLVSMGAAIALVAAVAGTTIAAGGDPFTRSWSRVDVDGSRETLRFAGSGVDKTYAYRDERATFCGGDVFESNGTANVDGNVATFEGLAGCVGDAPSPAGGTFTYDPGAGTIADGTGLLFHRGNGAREAFLGVWKATDLDGSAMMLTIRGDGLVRDVSYQDDLATVCDPDAVWKAEGSGTIGSTPGWGRYITVSLEGGCLDGGPIAYDEVYRYDVETDTLRGPLGLDGSETLVAVDWHRG